ncbi:MAG TPA: carboxypeptidase-like regulatory domain-containing protein, partial [Vicinamibacterales bacterium]|nr:carboxypeptidase-like regulatory domain-containing protein [Vicinamibacterales bacterium]
MVARVVRRLLMVGVLLILPTLATAQEATLSGTVVDATGGVLPGATLTAVLEASGNTFEGVTDERGAYRIAARAGVYRLTVAMPGFGNVNRQGIELLV